MLHAIVGPMRSNKSGALLHVLRGYRSQGATALLLQPEVDTKAGFSVTSRSGRPEVVDLMVRPDMDVSAWIQAKINRWGNIQHVCVDETQFLSPEQVIQLYELSIETVAVACSALRTNFQGHMFLATTTLLALADTIEQTTAQCSCGKPAHFNARQVDGIFTQRGNETIIDESHDGVTYHVLCGKCYLDLVGAITPS
jgi:thymidine kinase